MENQALPSAVVRNSEVSDSIARFLGIAQLGGRQQPADTAEEPGSWAPVTHFRDCRTRIFHIIVENPGLRVDTLEGPNSSPEQHLLGIASEGGSFPQRARSKS